MRVIEEVKTLRLQFISLFLVFVSTVLIQYADFRIGEYQNLVFQEILEASNLLQIHTTEKLTANFSVFQQFLPFQSLSQDNQESLKNRITSLFKSQLDQDPDIAELTRKLEAGSIPLRRYYTESATIHEDKSHKYLNQYNKKILSIKTMLKTGTAWKSIKTYILFPLQVAFICVLAIGYYSLMRRVSNRVEAKK